MSVKRAFLPYARLINPAYSCVYSCWWPQIDLQRTSVLSHLCTHVFCSVHVQGHPVLIQRLGRVDLKALYKVTSEERLKLHHVREYEHLRALIFPACSRVAGRHIDQLFIIIDLDGISFT